jgi:DNA-binding transcriptional LysR family regulator
MQLRQITYFLRICDTLNFTRAAELCSVSQPSLSSAINKLEEELGGKLFHRKERSIQLTPLGHAMRTELGRVEHAKHAALTAAKSITNDQSDVINLGLMCTLSPQNLLEALASFGASEFGNSELLVHDIPEANWHELLITEAIDCVIVAHTESLPTTFESRSLNTEKMVLGLPANHPLTETTEVFLDQLQEYRYVDRLRCEFRDMFFKDMAEKAIDINVTMRSEREDLVQKSISAGVGISMMPESAILDSGLEYREIKDLNIERQISFVSKKVLPVKNSVKLLIEHLVRAYSV